jgi:hypothetical protein
MVLLAGCDQIITGGPMGRQEALNHSQLNLPLPSSAHEVFYLYLDRGSQDQDLYVRFSGDPKEIESFAIAFFKKENALRLRMGQPVSDPVVETNMEAIQNKPWPGFGTLPKWWDPDSIIKGSYIWNGLGGESSAHFWIDELNGRAFFLR